MWSIGCELACLTEWWTAMLEEFLYKVKPKAAVSPSQNCQVKRYKYNNTILLPLSVLYYTKQISLLSIGLWRRYMRCICSIGKCTVLLEWCYTTPGGVNNLSRFLVQELFDMGLEQEEQFVQAPPSQPSPIADWPPMPQYNPPILPVKAKQWLPQTLLQL